MKAMQGSSVLEINKDGVFVRNEAYNFTVQARPVGYREDHYVVDIFQTRNYSPPTTTKEGVFALGQAMRDVALELALIQERRMIRDRGNS